MKSGDFVIHLFHFSSGCWLFSVFFSQHEGRFARLSMGVKGERPSSSDLRIKRGHIQKLLEIIDKYINIYIK